MTSLQKADTEVIQILQNQKEKQNVCFNSNSMKTGPLHKTNAFFPIAFIKESNQSAEL